MKVRRDSPTLVAAQPLTLRECQDAISSWQRIVATEHALRARGLYMSRNGVLALVRLLQEDV